MLECILFFKKRNLNGFQKVDLRLSRLIVIIGSTEIAFLPWDRVEDEKVRFQLVVMCSNQITLFYFIFLA